MAPYMRRAQKGVDIHTSGAKYLLLVDRAVSGNCKTMKTNFCSAWIDTKKAYDSMPNALTLESLELYKINRTLTTFIKNLMAYPGIQLKAN